MRSKSTYFIIFYCSLSLCSWIVITSAYPTEDQNLSFDSSESFSKEFINENSNSNEKDSLVRNKRTIGFLRQLFPGLSQIIDRKIQQITRVIFRVVGRLILRGGNAGGGAAAAGGDAGGDKGTGARRVSITLPTYPPFEDEEEEDSTDAPTSEKETASSDQSTVRVNVSSTTASSISDNSTTTEGISSSSSTSTDPNIATEPQDSNTIRRINRDVSDVLGETTLSISVEETSSTTEAATTKRPAGLLSRLREMRSKRGSGLFRFGNGGSGGGSGNFLFDVIRLIAGSGTSPEKDEEQNAPRDERQGDSIDSNDVNGSSSSYNDDSYTAGIPGPLTRLFILANRGISNLIQDLILRLAQTGERIVNFKARLITSII